MSPRSIELLLDDILESIDKIERYTAGMNRDTFIGDDKTVDSVVRNLEIIGEAANRLPDQFRETHSEIDWQGIVGLRNRIVHAYFGIDLEIIWQILKQTLPAFKKQLIEVRARPGQF